MKSSKEKRKN